MSETIWVVQLNESKFPFFFFHLSRFWLDIILLQTKQKILSAPPCSLILSLKNIFSDGKSVNWVTRCLHFCISYALTGQTLDKAKERRAKPKGSLRSRDRLGPGTLLQSLNLDKYLLGQQNTKKLQGTKNNCIHVQLEWILDKIQKSPLKPNYRLWRVRSKNRVLCMSPALSTTKGWANHLSRPPTWPPRHTLTLHKEPTNTPLREQAKESVVCSHCFLLQESQ